MVTPASLPAALAETGVLSTGAILERLRIMVADLAEFGVREEKQFLAIGGRLADFHGRAREVTERSEEAIHCLMGDEGGGALADLQALLDGFHAHVDRGLGESRHNDESLSLLVSHFERIEQPLKALAKVVKVLLSLSFSTRVESTQSHANQTLQVLAHNLKDLAAKINDKTEQVRDRLQQMAEMTGDAREKMRQLQEESLQQAHATLQHSRRLVEKLAERRQHALDAAILLKNHSRQAIEAIGEVVASIQFHDITRQQVEHVRDALEEVGREFSGKAAGAVSRVAIIDVCRVQAAQLRHTRGELVAAVARIIKALNDISQSVGYLSRQTRVVSGTAEQDGSSFFKDIEPVITSITFMLEQSVADNHSATAAVRDVLQAMSELNQLLEQIVLIGTEMKLIAFNAGITAAHNMERGAGLGVIANSIQSLSTQVLERTDEFSAGYQQMNRLVLTLADHAQVSGVRQDEQAVAQLNSQADALFLRLREMNRTLIGLLRDMDARSAALAEDIMTTADGITIHFDASRLFDEILSGMEDVTGGFHAAHGDINGEGRMMDRLSRRYTMESEREIHMKASRARSRAAEPGVNRAGSDGGSGLGDNVEFF